MDTIPENAATCEVSRWYNGAFDRQKKNGISYGSYLY